MMKDGNDKEVYQRRMEKMEKLCIDTDILADLERKGEIIEFRDAFIASIAITQSTILFTRNISHFERINGIKLYE